jgi:hypothetical protein
MKRLKLLPIIISISLVHSSFAASIFDINASSYLMSEPEDMYSSGLNLGASIGDMSGISTGAAGITYGLTSFNNSLKHGGLLGQSKIPGHISDTEYGEESFNSGVTNWLSISSEHSFNCNENYIPSAAVKLAETFSDGTCQSTINKKTEYCSCIQDRVESLGLAEKYKNQDTKALVEDKTDKIKKAYLFDLTNNAVFSYVAMSEKVGYGMLSSVGAHLELSEIEKETKAPLCIPGNLQALIKDLKDKKGNPCFDEEDKKGMAGVFARSFKERKKEFPNIDFGRGLYKGVSFDSLIEQTDYHLEKSFVDGLKGVSNFGINEKFLEKSPAEMIASSYEIGNEVLPNRMLALQHAYTIGKEQANGELNIMRSVSPTGYMTNLAEIESVYLKDPIMREQFYSYMYSYGQSKQLERSVDRLINYNDNVQQFESTEPSFYRFQKVMDDETDRAMKRRALESIAMNMYNTVLDKSGKKEISADDFTNEMSKIRKDAILTSAKFCNKAFEQVKKACNMSPEEILKDTVDNPKKMQHIVNRLVDYEDTSDKKNQDDYIQQHVKTGAIACVQWNPRTIGEDTKSNIFAAARSMNTDSYEDGEGVRVAVSETFETGTGVEEGEVVEAHGVVEASQEEYERVTGFSDSPTSTPSSAFKNPLASTVGNFTTSNFDNFRNIASVGSADSADSASDAPASDDGSSDPQVNSLINGYNSKIADMQKKLDEMSKKLEEAEKKKQADEMAKLNEAISKATSTINKLQSDKKKLVEQLASGNAPGNAGPIAAPTTAANPSGASVVEQGIEPKSAVSAGGSGVAKADGLSPNSSFTSRRNAAGVLVDANGMTSDDYLYQLREGSMQGQTGTVLTLSSLKDPSIGDQVKTAFKSGDRVIYANVNGSVYRIIPQVDSDGNIIEKGGEVVYVTEIVGGEIDSELKEMQDGKVKGVVASKEKKTNRAPASEPSPAGMIQQGNSDDVKFGYDAMMDLTEEALEK